MLYNNFGEQPSENYLPEAYEAMLMNKYNMGFGEYESFLNNNAEYLVLNGAYQAYLEK